MDFTYHYTENQENFRREVAAWLDTTVARDVQSICDSGPDLLTAYENLRRELGIRGWLAALDAREQGGGGLDDDQNVVLLEELNRRGVLFILNDATLALRNALLKLGTETQKNRLVPALASGQLVVWRQAYIKGDPVDLTAVPDADGYILTGQAIFSGRGSSPSWLWALAMVESDIPSESSAASFLVSPFLDGIETSLTRTLSGLTVGQVFFDRVWVPRSDLIGDDGVLVMRADMAWSRGADLPTALESETNTLLEYARETTSHATSRSSEPVRQQLLIEAYIASRIMRLLRMRASWMNDSGHGEGHEGSEAVLWEERASRHLSQIVQHVVGVYALLDHSDHMAVAGGRFEYLLRGELAARGEISGIGTTEHAIATVLGLADAKDPAAVRTHEESATCR
ncbi:acyl-CoA dehydrogenase family protein [Dehalococcoidia bacterium]|nr:acyl-CoA dehydrogenase family protein [Dehalococcoidia bacterium]